MRQFFACKLAVLYLLLSCVSLTGQCPGARSCSSPEVVCGFTGLNGLSCITSDVPTALPSFVCGSVTPTHAQWWAFCAEETTVTINISYSSGICPASTGIMAGISSSSCELDPIDCSTDCNSRNISLTARIEACEVYYLWIQDCNEDACTFNVQVIGDNGPPTLPSPLPNIELDGAEICIGRKAEFYLGLPDICEFPVYWYVDREFQRKHYLFDYLFTQDRDYEVCYTMKLETSTSVCDEGTHCQTFRPTIEKEKGKLRLPCVKKDPFNWHGLIISQDCINPPCTVRTENHEGCLVDSIRPIKYAPIPARLGTVVSIDPANLPYTWHGQIITTSCISPPCTARLEGPDGCLFDSVKIFKVLQFQPDHGFLKGSVYNDINNNCQKDRGEPFLENIQIQIEGGQNTFQTLTDQNGFYSLEVPFDDYEIRALDLTDSLFSCPVPAEIKVDRQDSTYCQDFFKFPVGCYPGRIHILPLQDLGRMRCDRRQRKLTIEFYNTDNDELAAEKVILTVDRHMDLLDASLPFNQVGNREIVIDVPALQPGEKISAEITFRGDCSIQNENDEVCWTARYENGYVCNGLELMSKYCDIIVNSRDPNDLTISPFGKTNRRLIERVELQGIIRFHNDGTAPALDVYIDLNLPYDKLDINTIQLLDTSADDIDMTVLSDRIRFNMPNINLPNDALDSIKSHGYVSYSIQVDPNVVDWEKIEQQADIYFDINAAVPTNTEKQIISGDFIRNNIEATACVGDTFKGVLILGDTIFSDTLIGSGPDEINKYYVVSHPSYHLQKDTQMLAGYELNGVRITKDTIIDFRYQTTLGCDSIVTWTVDAQTTKTEDLEESVVLYPNPVSGNFLHLSGDISSIKSVQFVQMSGSSIFEKQVENGKIGIGDLSQGVYLYKLIRHDGASYTGSLVVK